MLNIDGEKYELIFFINKSPNHYKTFFKRENDYLLLDDNYSSPKNSLKTVRVEKL